MIDKHTELDKCAEIIEIQKKYRGFFEIVTGGIFVFILVVIGIAIFIADLPSYCANVYVTLIGIAVGVLIIDKRAEQRAIRQRKEELILQMGSPKNIFAVEAVRILRLKGWLTDGSLVGKNFGMLIFELPIWARLYLKSQVF